MVVFLVHVLPDQIFDIALYVSAAFQLFDHISICLPVQVQLDLLHVLRIVFD